MQLTGTLRSWHDDRGFGFIAPTHGGAELFVHVSAFSRDGSRPTVGEKLSYELGRGRDGKPQAVKVVRLAVGAERRDKVVVSSSGARAGRPRSSWLGTVVLLAILVVVAGWGYRHFSALQHRRALAAEPAQELSQPLAAPVEAAATPPVTSSFRCDGRTHCSQMTSCAEATWFINNCPGTRMDGNNDGVPCEQQWCVGR